MKKKVTIPTELDEILLYQAINFLLISGRDDLSDVVKHIHAVSKFTGLPIHETSGISNKKLKELYLEIAKVLQEENECPMKRFFTLNGVKYGLEPDIRDMEAGAFIDIDTYTQSNYIRNLHKLMAILYRPVVSEVKGFYKIERYVNESSWKKEHREKLFLNAMPYSYVRGLTLFFSELAQKFIDSSKKEVSQEKEAEGWTSGVGTTQSIKPQKETQRKTKKS